MFTIDIIMDGDELVFSPSPKQFEYQARRHPTVVNWLFPDLNFFDSAQCLMVRRWRLIGQFPILYNPTVVAHSSAGGRDTLFVVKAMYE